ncbi:hypothetical protein SeMB42_g03480 [Synchytrium endobioticum]|uniref:GTP-binding protein n=1 Tax=Synchytrium endobioticum TaxID=286115 RepID=A0A507D6E5_9FUNG|nr:hypothetical protein SeMB42_g03480 [Synchytrium endobioticum]
MARPYDYAHDDDDIASIRANGYHNTTAAEKPRLLLMGLRRSGKSSIQRVVFHKMAANDTLYLEPTVRIGTADVTSFIAFQICDFPGQIDVSDSSFRSDAIFATCKVLVFVIDSQDDFLDAVQRLHGIVTEAYKVNPSIHFEVFIHKVDGLSDDHKIGMPYISDV